MKNIRNFQAPSLQHLQELRANPKKVVSNLVDSFLKVISFGESLFEEGALLDDVILFDERLKDHLTRAIGFRIDESLTQVLYDKICDDLKGGKKQSNLNYFVLYSVFMHAFVGDFLVPNYEDAQEELYHTIRQNVFPFVRDHLDPFYKKRLESFLKVLENHKVNPRVRCGFYLNLSQIFNSFGALDLPQRDSYAKASLEEALKIDEDGIKAKALKQLKIYLDEISQSDLSKRCTFEIARLPTDLEEEL